MGGRGGKNGRRGGTEGGKGWGHGAQMKVHCRDRGDTGGPWRGWGGTRRGEGIWGGMGGMGDMGGHGGVAVTHLLAVGVILGQAGAGQGQVPPDDLDLLGRGVTLLGGPRVGDGRGRWWNRWGPPLGAHPPPGPHGDGVPAAALEGRVGQGGGRGIAAGSPTHGRSPTGPPWGWAVPGAALGTPLGGGRRGWHCGGRRWRCG